MQQKTCDGQPKLYGPQLAPTLPSFTTVPHDTVRPEYKMCINMICHNLGYGGAERIIQDLVAAYAKSTSSLCVNLHILAEKERHYRLLSAPHISVQYPLGRTYKQKLHNTALRIRVSPSPIAYTHLLAVKHLEILWRFGIKTIPVIHNSSPAWRDSPIGYDAQHVPFVVAVSAAVRDQLREAGCSLPVQVVRHEIQRFWTENYVATARARVRAFHGIESDCTLIVMVGRFRLQKGYVRALEVLDQLKKRIKVHLLIVGEWDHSTEGREAHRLVMQVAEEKRLLHELTILSNSDDSAPYLAAADVFLNTSNYEGYSLATLEARQLGCPVVSPHTAENLCPGASASLMFPPADSADPAAYAVQVMEAKQQRLPPRKRPRFPSLVPKLWVWMANYGVDCSPRNQRAVLFLTSNLQQGGAQRSLVNLLTHLHVPHPVFLGILHPAVSRYYADQLAAANIQSFTFDHSVPKNRGLIDSVFEIIERLGTHTIVFWNFDVETRIAITKIYENRDIRIIEVSPGPKMFADLESSPQIFHRMGYSLNEYFNRVDTLVSKYTNNPHIESYPQLSSKVCVLPNGVPVRDIEAADSLPSILPNHADPEFAVVAACRICPQKRLIELLHVAAKLRQLEPRATLTIFGGVRDKDLTYWDLVMKEYAALNLAGTVVFAGDCDDIASYLNQFKVFIMLSDLQGCPNASLEAMEAGLPVVANDDGGTIEQVVNGVTGFVAKDIDPDEVAQKVHYLLTHPLEMSRLGSAGRKRVRELFSMSRMVRGYKKLLWGE